MTTLRSQPEERIKHLLARIRSRQLDKALRGEVDVSARYARRAMRVRAYSKGLAVQV